MIQSKLIAGKQVITSEIFPEICTCRMVTNNNVKTTYCDTPFLKCQMEEKRVGRFMVMNQNAQATSDCIFEVHRSGSPVLMLTLAKDCNCIRQRHEEHLWQTGDIGLTLASQEDIVKNYANKWDRLNMSNIIIPEPVVRQLAEINPFAMETICRDFEKERSIEYDGIRKANRRLYSMFHAIEMCNNMGNYSEKYLESKIMDGLTEYLNLANGEKDLSMKYNFVLRSKMIDARQIIEERYQAPPSLVELAAMVGTNDCTLKKAFKQLFGTTVFQYIFDFRMKLAEERLLYSNTPIVIIARELGFYDPSHFCHAFRQKFGLTTTEFCQRHHVYRDE